MTSDKKQARQFIIIYISFFNKYKGGNLFQLGQKATDEEIMEADGATLILVNQKIGHKNGCTHHETNG